MTHAVTERLRSEARWLVMHRASRTLMQVQARRGRPVAALLIDPAVRADPWATQDRVRAIGPVIEGPATWATASHAVIAATLRDDRFGVTRISDAGAPGLMRMLVPPASAEVASPVQPPSLLAVDPPVHTRYRRMVSRPFTPRALGRITEQLGERTEALLDDLATRGPDAEIDVITDYAALLPVGVIGDLLGVPESMYAQLLEWGHEIALDLDIGMSRRDFHRCRRGLADMNVWLDQHLADLRANPGEDVLSGLVTATGDDALTPLELRATALLLLGAGFETTVNLIGSGVEVLAGRPDLRARLAAEPELWGQATEELLRLESPVQLTSRTPRVDVEIEGVTVPAGTPLLCLIGAANRDPEVFDDPHAFDLDRPNSREHLSFSGGIHFCLGAGLARMEGEVALRGLFTRFPQLRVSGPGTRRQLQTLRGWDHLPVVLGAPA